VHVKRNTEARSCKRCSSGKAISITYSEFVFVAWGIRPCSAHETCCNLWPSRLYIVFPRYHKRQAFRKKKVTEQLLTETYLILGKTQQDTVRNVYYTSCKVLVILVRLCWNFIFSTDFRKILKTSNFMKIRPVGGELFYADGWAYGQTDMTDLIVVFAIWRTNLMKHQHTYY
jgi:hypothetical protein